MMRSLVSLCSRLAFNRGGGGRGKMALVLQASRCHRAFVPKMPPFRSSIGSLTSNSPVNCVDMCNGVKTDTGNDTHQDANVSDMPNQTGTLEEARKEVENLYTIGWQAPEKIGDSDLEHYVTLTTKKGRKKFLRFLFKKEMIKRKEKMKKEERAKLRAQSKKDEDLESDGPLENRMFLRVQSNTILQFDRWRLAASMMFGPKIVFDFSYEDLMRRQEVISLVQQLLHALNANKHAKDPFNVHWVGLTEETQSLQQMKRMLGDSLETMMVNDTDKDLLDVFKREDLVYLSADSPNVLKSYDSEKVYVIGALVDSHIIYSGQSLARAKRHGIEHARLPLDQHLHWSTGAKNLTIDQMMKIMIEMNTSGNWVKSLQHVPIRKHAGLRSSLHWNNKGDGSRSQQRQRQDSIERNPSQFVSSRAKHFKHRNCASESVTSSRMRRVIASSEEEDDTDSTVFTPKVRTQASWFDGD